MNKRAKRLILSIALTVLVIGLPGQVIPLKMCCVAGNYKGSHINDQLPNCPIPKSETFSLAMMQSNHCGENVWGTITSPSGGVQNFTGTLTRGARGCCVLTAKFGTHGHVTTFTGSLCLRLGKWQAKGTYIEIGSGDPCKKTGTWGMKQI